MGGKEVGERVMGCEIREMEMGKGGWEIRNWGKGRKERERERGKEQRALFFRVLFPPTLLATFKSG